VEQFEPFRVELGVELAEAGDIAFGPAEAGDEVRFQRIADAGEDDRDGTGRGLRGPNRGQAARCDDDRDLAANELRSEAWEPIDIALGPAVFDAQILAFAVALLLQTRAEGGGEVRVLIARKAAEEADEAR